MVTCVILRTAVLCILWHFLYGSFVLYSFNSLSAALRCLVNTMESDLLNECVKCKSATMTEVVDIIFNRIFYYTKLKVFVKLSQLVFIYECIFVGGGGLILRNA